MATDFVWNSPDEPHLATDYQSDIKLLGISPSMTADAENCLPACASADPHEYPGGGDCASWFCNPLEYQAQFEVTDKAQNSAEINLTIVVRPINMTKIISDPTSPAAKTFTELATNVETTFADGFVFRFIPEWMVCVCVGMRKTPGCSEQARKCSLLTFLHACSRQTTGVITLVAITALLLTYINASVLVDTMLSVVRASQLLILPKTLANDRLAFDRAYTFILWVQSVGIYWKWSDHELDTKLEEEVW